MQLNSIKFKNFLNNMINRNTFKDENKEEKFIKPIQQQMKKMLYNR